MGNNRAKKRVLFINGHLNVGGVEKSLVDVLRHLDHGRYEVDLLLLEGLGDYEKELPSHVKVMVRSLEHTQGPLLANLAQNIRRRDWFSVRMRLILLLSKVCGQSWMRLAKGLLTNHVKYDCAIAYRSGICMQVAAYAVNARRKIGWWHHGEFNVSREEYTLTAMKCDMVVAVSKSCAEMLLQELPCLDGRIRVIPNMVDEDVLREKANTESPYVQDVPHWVTVCRISPEKHVENILYAAKQLKERGHSFMWHIVGDGVLRVQLEQEAKTMGVDDCVCFEGSQRNPYSFMKYAQLYIHSSYVESQGLTILEAMTLGTPCVATKSRGPCEFIRHEQNGFLVDKSPEALALGVEYVLKKPQLLEQIQKNSVCPNMYAPSVVIKEIEASVIC